MFCLRVSVISLYYERVRVSVYHHLDMQKIFRADVKSSFCSSYTRPRCWVVCLSHGICLAVHAIDGLVDHFQHANIPIISVGVDDVGYPFEEFVGALVLVVNIEAC